MKKIRAWKGVFICYPTITDNMAETGSPQDMEGGQKERENLDRLLKIFNGGTGVNLGVGTVFLLEILGYKYHDCE